MTDTTMTFYYLDNWTDEVVPCHPTLQDWAKWLSEPDTDWNRDEPANDGDEFAASSLVVLGDVRAEWKDGRYEAVTAAPEGTDFFFLRHYEGSPGWDAAFSADTIADAAAGHGKDDGPLWFAAVRDGQPVRVRYNIDEAGPRLTILGAVQ